MVGTPLSGIKAKKKYLYDVTERVAWTFIEAFGAQLVFSGWFSVQGVTDLSILEKAALAGVASVLALAKGFVAQYVGAKNDASTLPAEVS